MSKDLKRVVIERALKLLKTEDNWLLGTTAGYRNKRGKVQVVDRDSREATAFCWAGAIGRVVDDLGLDDVEKQLRLMRDAMKALSGRKTDGGAYYWILISNDRKGYGFVRRRMEEYLRRGV